MMDEKRPLVPYIPFSLSAGVIGFLLSRSAYAMAACGAAPGFAFAFLSGLAIGVLVAAALQRRNWIESTRNSTGT